MEALFWSIILLLAGIGFIGLEVFVPSGGVLGVLAALAVIGSLVIAFAMGGVTIGLIMLVTTVVVIPLVIAAVIRWWPYTPIGRMVVLHAPESEDEVLPDTAEYRTLKSLVGHRGVAKSKMLPSGAVEIDGDAYDAVSEGMAIEPGQPIRVTTVRANRIVVTLDAGGPMDSTESPDVLAQPAESLGIDSLEDPPASM